GETVALEKILERRHRRHVLRGNLPPQPGPQRFADLLPGIVTGGREPRQHRKLRRVGVHHDVGMGGRRLRRGQQSAGPHHACQAPRPLSPAPWHPHATQPRTSTVPNDTKRLPFVGWPKMVVAGWKTLISSWFLSRVIACASGLPDS